MVSSAACFWGGPRLKSWHRRELLIQNKRNYKTVLTLSTKCFLSFINEGMFSEQKRLMSLIPLWDPATGTPSCTNPQEPTIHDYDSQFK